MKHPRFNHHPSYRPRIRLYHPGFLPILSMAYLVLLTLNVEAMLVYRAKPAVTEFQTLPEAGYATTHFVNPRYHDGVPVVDDPEKPLLLPDQTGAHVDPSTKQHPVIGYPKQDFVGSEAVGIPVKPKKTRWWSNPTTGIKNWFSKFISKSQKQPKKVDEVGSPGKRKPNRWWSNLKIRFKNSFSQLLASFKKPFRWARKKKNPSNGKIWEPASEEPKPTKLAEGQPIKENPVTQQQPPIKTNPVAQQQQPVKPPTQMNNVAPATISPLYPDLNTQNAYLGHSSWPSSGFGNGRPDGGGSTWSSFPASGNHVHQQHPERPPLQPSWHQPHLQEHPPLQPSWHQPHLQEHSPLQPSWHQPHLQPDFIPLHLRRQPSHTVESQPSPQNVNSVLEDLNQRKITTKIPPSAFWWPVKYFQGYSVTQRFIEPDGNCMFRAFAYMTYGDQEKHGSIRSEIIDYLKNNPHEFEESVVGGIQEHIRKLEDGAWGDEIEEAVFNKLYRENYIVVIDTGKSVHHVVRQGDKFSDEFTALLLHGEHYELLAKDPERKLVQNSQDRFQDLTTKKYQ